MIQGKRGGSSAGAESWNGGEDRQSLLDGNNHDERENSGGDGGGGQSKVAADAIDDIVQIQVPGRVRLNDMPEMARLDKAIAGHGRSDDGSGYDDDDDLHATLDLEDPLRDHDDDYDDGDDDYDDHDHDHDAELPLLLTGIEAPAVALANDLDRQDDAADAVAREMRRPKSGLASAFMNMANSIIGAGIIGQPYALRQAGLLAGVVLLVGLTAMVDWTVRLLVINSKLSGTSSFQGTVAHCFGRPGLVAISLAQWVFAFGGMVAFGVIIGDTIPHVLMAAWPGLAGVPVVGLMTDRRVAIAVLVLGVSLPLTLYRDIAKLAKASTFALVGMVVIVTTVLVQGFLVPSEARGGFSLPLLTVNDGIFQAIGVISFAFVCHHNSLLIYGSLRKPTIDNFSRVTHYSTGVSMLACLAMGLGGFLAFGNRTLGNVLNNLPSDSGAVNGARLLFGLNMLTTLPLEAFVCREVMVTYWWPGEGFSMRRHVALSTGLVAAAVGLSVATCDLGAVFELVGATSAVAMAFILPPLCYLRLATRSWRTYLAVSVVAFGALVMVISVAQAVRKLVNGTGDAVQCH